MSPYQTTTEPSPAPRLLAAALACSIAAVAGCGDGGAGPTGSLRFVDHDIDIGLTQSGAVQIVNEGREVIEGVRFGVVEVRDSTGLEVGGASISVFGSAGAPLEPGRKFDFGFRIETARLPPGSFELVLGVFHGSTLSDRTRVRWGRTQSAMARPSRMEIRGLGGPTFMPGDSIRFRLDAFTSSGQPVQTSEALWYVLPTDAGPIDRRTGLLVPSATGTVRVVAAIGNVKDEITVRIVRE